MVLWAAYVIAFIFVLVSTNNVIVAFVTPFFLFIFLWPLLLVVDVIVTIIRKGIKK